MGASYANVTKLRALVKEEEKVRQRRKEHFFSKEFVTENPGALFPASWKPSSGIARQMPDGRARQLCARPEFTGAALVMLGQILKSSTPTFDRMTEEGMRYLIYQLGSLEVRATQDMEGEETIGAVFSIRKPSTDEPKKPTQTMTVQASEKITR